MVPQVNDPFRDLTLERWQDLARRELVLRAEAKRSPFPASVSVLRRAVECCLRSRPTPNSAQGCRLREIGLNEQRDRQYPQATWRKSAT
jgi:hypothetical protein